MINKIHYIWIGSIIPEKYIYNISYPYFNSDNNIYIWTDQPIKNEKKFRDYLGYSSNLPMKRLYFYDINILDSYCKEFLFPRLDFTERKTFINSMMLEYNFYPDRIIPHYDLAVFKRLGNLATLSDILRLIILYKEGGIYIDCDNTFRGQSYHSNDINKTKLALKRKRTEKFKIHLPHKNILYSNQKWFGNSILASHSKAEGTLKMFRNTLNAIFQQLNNKEKSKYFTDKNLLSEKFRGDSQYKHFLDQLLKNKIINSDSDLRRFGKFKSTKLKNMNEDFRVYECSIPFIYPYAALAIAIGPDKLQEFEDSEINKLSSDFTFDIEGFIKLNSDQEWL
ncbi:glycosyltransferase [Silvanigrella aquatica]|uniref:Uncharacterized protein n=1 Tax=Silvanigrella aquatica TaxID=1915309 RepID=A0A1L4D0X7_9BACT|nr:glycosyltransferase [Silvanigrella aquatica]APJ03872.1 hypothetical protein AXG55_08110 [Silvanigrella aquatica]